MLTRPGFISVGKHISNCVCVGVKHFNTEGLSSQMGSACSTFKKLQALYQKQRFIKARRRRCVQLYSCQSKRGHALKSEAKRRYSRKASLHCKTLFMPGIFYLPHMVNYCLPPLRDQCKFLSVLKCVFLFFLFFYHCSYVMFYVNRKDLDSLAKKTKNNNNVNISTVYQKIVKKRNTFLDNNYILIKHKQC